MFKLISVLENCSFWFNNHYIVNRWSGGICPYRNHQKLNCPCHYRQQKLLQEWFIAWKFDSFLPFFHIVAFLSFSFRSFLSLIIFILNQRESKKIFFTNEKNISFVIEMKRDRTEKEVLMFVQLHLIDFANQSASAVKIEIWYKIYCPMVISMFMKVISGTYFFSTKI